MLQRIFRKCDTIITKTENELRDDYIYDFLYVGEKYKNLHVSDTK